MSYILSKNGVKIHHNGDSKDLIHARAKIRPESFVNEPLKAKLFGRFL
ncbi:hypothetical protein CCAND38_130016 [Capnocytophaga canis]|uniref:Uncharacterized protein n=1 Tax=Capnocytophaga canis TaxID=1848903 RepID=A0A0B7HYV0_9FLAO|nr:hypothetical protein CCAND38_130016 [Capnocytophaga canis]